MSKQRTLGIILAGGTSSRLYPATLVATKQLLPVYDKPLIYYPLSTLMLAGIKDFVIISTPKEIGLYKELFFDAENKLGINIQYGVQTFALGIADAFNIVDDMHETLPLDDFNRFALILGDNIFYGASLTQQLKEANQWGPATIFSTHVPDPQRFGVVEVDCYGGALSIEEKPKKPKSDMAVTGLYFYPRSVFEMVRKQKPSARKELEITDLNKEYIKTKSLKVFQLLRGMMWFDTGTADAMLEASNMIRLIQSHQGFMVGSPHEVAYNNNWIGKEELEETALLCEKSDYGKYLMELIKCT